METILVVDDEPDVCDLAWDCLVAAGYRVLQAGDDEEALRIAEAHTEPIHLLLTDIVMPRLNGVELAGRLTRQRHDTKVLYMSGFAVVGAQHELLSGPGLEPGDPILPIKVAGEAPTQREGLGMPNQDGLTLSGPAVGRFHSLARAPRASRPQIIVEYDRGGALLSLDIGIGEPGHERSILSNAALSYRRLYP